MKRKSKNGRMFNDAIPEVEEKELGGGRVLDMLSSR